MRKKAKKMMRGGAAKKAAPKMMRGGGMAKKLFMMRDGKVTKKKMKRGVPGRRGTHKKRNHDYFESKNFELQVDEYIEEAFERCG